MCNIHLQRVRREIAENPAIATFPALLSSDNATQQEMAKAHYLQTILVSVTLDAAMSDPTHLEQVKAAVRQGVSASGIHLEVFEMTEAGVVLKQ